MAEARLFHQVEADRWEAIPERDVVRGVIDDVGVRILVDESSVAVGFVVDIDGDIESRLDVLRRYMSVESFESHLRSTESNPDGVIVDVMGHPVASRLPALVGPTTGSRNIRLAQLDRGFAVTIALGWWFSMWGMWFTITRGDGLVLADLPVRRGSTEIVPNAFPVRPGDVRATMRRGPRTTRRIVLAVAAAVALITAIVLGSSDSTSTLASVDVPSTEPVNSQPTGPQPTITLPPQREAATDYVSVDDRSHLDVAIMSTQVAPGDTVEVLLTYDKSAINTFGSLGPNGDQSDAYLSCQSARRVYREVPAQSGATEQFRIFLVSDNDVRIQLADTYVQLTLAGAMVEGCPEAQTSGVDPYRVLQRTFYVPTTVPVTIPADVESGNYAIEIELAMVQWATSTNTPINVS
jgi:hypothetical protein